jgi:hypothetical protein
MPRSLSSPLSSASQSAAPRALPCALLIASLCLLTATGCERKLRDLPRPLRPLVFTESLPTDDTAAGATALDNLRTPQDLGLTLYRSLITHDRALFTSTFASPELWAKAVGSTDVTKVTATVQKTLDGSDPLWDAFTPSDPTEAPVGGLSARLQLVSFDLGKGYDLRGKLAPSGQEQQFYSNRLSLQLRGTDKVFSISVPKIVLTEQGWRIAKEPLTIDPMLRTYLDAGMHLKPELLHTDHYPYPLAVGNFWKYRVHQVGTFPTPKPAPSAATPPAAGLAPGISTPPAELTMRLSVTSVETFSAYGYWLVTFEQLYNTPERPSDSFRYLVTPKRIYLCDSECRKKIHNVSFVLAYIAKQTPHFIFPLPEEGGWGEAGLPVANRKSAFTVEPGEHKTQVPAGDFERARHIVRSTPQGRETRSFVAGTGIVLRKVRAGSAELTEELIQHRLMH